MEQYSQEADVLENHTDKYNEYAALLDQYDKELDDIYHYYALRCNLSDAALWILYAVYGSKEGVTQTDICNGWFFSRQTINTALKGLEQQKIIRLDPIPGNRKSKYVTFTDDGQKLAQQIVAPLKQAENQVFASFSDEENQLFVEMAGKRCSLLRQFLGTHPSSENSAALPPVQGVNIQKAAPAMHSAGPARF